MMIQRRHAESTGRGAAMKVELRRSSIRRKTRAHGENDEEEQMGKKRKRRSMC